MILIKITLIIIIIKNKIFKTKFSSYDRSIMVTLNNIFDQNDNFF